MDYTFASRTFSRTGLGGNQLAVVPEARGRSAARARALVKEFDCSESAFVLPPQDPGQRAAGADRHADGRAAVRRPSGVGRRASGVGRRALGEPPGAAAEFAARSKQLRPSPSPGGEVDAVTEA